MIMKCNFISLFFAFLEEAYNILVVKYSVVFFRCLPTIYFPTIDMYQKCIFARDVTISSGFILISV